MWWGVRKAVGSLVALRKESVDRNLIGGINRAIDIIVALRKESVDRNIGVLSRVFCYFMSLSARRAWIEILVAITPSNFSKGRSPQGERG